MRHPLLSVILAVLCASCSQKPVPMTEAQLVGKWSCGRIPFRSSVGGEITSLVTEVRTDHTWRDVAKVSLWPGDEDPSHYSVTYTDGSEGTWRLDGDIIVFTTSKVSFHSSSTPGFGLKEWQAVVESVPYTERERILSFDGRRREMDEDRLVREWSVKPWACWKF